MIIIFGWLKEKTHTSGFIRCYCYNCSEVRRWGLRSETEWVSFYGIKTIPFLTLRYIYCECCGNEVLVPALKFFIHGNNHDALLSFVEGAQLAKKSETQRKYLLEKRSYDETHARRLPFGHLKPAAFAAAGLVNDYP